MLSFSPASLSLPSIFTVLYTQSSPVSTIVQCRGALFWLLLLVFALVFPFLLPLTNTLLRPGSAMGCCPFRSVPAPVWVSHRHSALPRLPSKELFSSKVVPHTSSCICCCIPSCISSWASSHLLRFPILSNIPVCPLQSHLPQQC